MRELAIASRKGGQLLRGSLSLDGGPGGSHRFKPGRRGEDATKTDGSPMHAQISTALAAVVLCGLAAIASAQEYCVTCTGPDVKYRCLIGGDRGMTARSSRGQMLCITELAQSGGHASCSVSRATTEPCDGQLKTVMFPAGTEPDAPPQAEAQPQTTAPPPAAAVPPPAEAPPGQPPSQEAAETAGEIADETANNSTDGLKKAGEAVSKTVQDTGNAVGNAVTKTWKCLSSFFGDC